LEQEDISRRLFLFWIKILIVCRKPFDLAIIELAKRQLFSDILPVIEGLKFPRQGKK